MEQNFAIMSSSIHQALSFNASTKYLIVECEPRNLLKLFIFIGYFFLQIFLFVLVFEVTKA